MKNVSHIRHTSRFLYRCAVKDTGGWYDKVYIDGNGKITQFINYDAPAKHTWNGANKFYMLKKLYGLSPEQYEKLYNDQNGDCVLCKRHVKLDVDHNHDTEKVRGMLCRYCNLMVGHAERIGIERIARYLTQ